MRSSTVFSYLTVLTSFSSVVVTAQYGGYGMVYFKESPTFSGASYNVHLAVSTDGLEWQPLNQNNPVAVPTAGARGLRDPFVLRKQSGGFVVLATDLNGTDWGYNSQYLHVWDSADLRSFTGYRRIKVHSLNTHAWAPEAFYDSSSGRYGIVYSAVTSSGHNNLLISYTTDFVTATDGVVFYDPGYDAIDGTFVTVNGVNYMYYKANNNGTFLGTRSSSFNPRSFAVYTGSFNPGRGVEAPEIIKHNSADTWYLWGDTWVPNGRLFAWSTTNVAGGSWSLLNDRAYTHPLNAKHPGVFALTSTEIANLRNTWGTPTWNRLKSYSLPDRYVRHSSNVGRVDAYPFDPYQDQLWTLVPGLANSSGVSFRSVNNPSMYLRHFNYSITLAASDGSSTFNADATFNRVSGWADGSWTSFQSYNYPDRYLRHSNYVLRIDPITSSSSATDKQDATFKVVY